MKMKKTTALALAFLILMSALAGCSKKGAITADGTSVYVPTGNTENEPVTEAEPDHPVDSALTFMKDDDLFTIKTMRDRGTDETMPLTVEINGQAIPAAGSNLYMPVGDDFQITDLYGLTASGYSIGVTSYALNVNIANVMKYSTPTELYIYDDHYYRLMNLYITTLPVIILDVGGKDIASFERECGFSMYTYGDNEFDITESDATIKTRGASSQSFEKCGLKLELKDEDGGANKIPLCGMRKDDDWILYASYSDNTHIRDVLSWHLWERITEKSEHKGALKTQYVEVIVNDRYNGLYVLMEKFDNKTLGLKDGETLVKCISWDVPASSTLFKAKKKNYTISSLEMKFPDEENAFDEMWLPMADYLRVGYEADGEGFAAEAESIVDVQNCIDYWLFLNITMLADNTWKNTYYASIDGKVYSFPWDCDISFGLSWTGVWETNFTSEDNGMWQRTYDFQFGRRLIKYIDSCRDYVKQRWEQMKNDKIADADTIIADANELWNIIHDSGAYTRNSQRWPATSKTDSLDYLEKTVRNREKWLDNYFASLD